MAMILSSKAFPADDAALDHFDAWFHGVKHKMDGCRVVVALESLGGARKKKLSAKEELAVCAADALFHNKEVWRRKGYVFDFVRKTYKWEGKEIYLTPGEALFLFHALVAKDVSGRQAFYLRNMRRRLGLAFLREVDIWKP